MDLKVEEMEGVRRKLKIQVPSDIVSQRVEMAYKQINQQIKMPGFRPGKIPKKILEKQVPLESMTQLWQDLMQEYYDKALMETGMIPAGPPEIDHSEINEIKKDKPFAFSVTIDIKPDMKIKDYKGLKFKKAEFKVTEDEVDASVRKSLEPFGTFEVCDADHQAEFDDFVKMDFSGTLAGEPLEGGDAKDYEVRIGQKRMIQGFEEQLIGHKAGEKFELKVQLPQDWNKKMRRVSMPIPGAEGQDAPDVATFKVELKEIKKVILPEITEEFVQAQGEESVESFRRKVRADIQSYKEHLEEVRIKQEIFEMLVKENEVEPPESLVKQELKFMIEGMKYQIMQSGMKLEDSGFEEEKAEADWRERAVYNTKGYVILDGIAKQEKINVTQSDLDAEYQRLAEETKKTVDEVKASMMGNQDYLNQTTTRILGQKALNYIYSHCEFEFVSEEEAKKAAQQAKNPELFSEGKEKSKDKK